MTISLLWDAGPGEIRAGLMQNGQVTELRLLRRNHNGPTLAAGEYYTARLLERPSHGKALVTLGRDVQAILQPASKLNEGALITVEMTRGPIPEPGRWKLPMVRPAPQLTPQSDPQWHKRVAPWVRLLKHYSGHIDEIVCPDLKAFADIQRALPDLTIPLRKDADVFIEADFVSLIDAAITGEFPITGGMLSIERTRAMTMIDIDGGGVPLALNLAAAREIPRLLRLYDIGGQIGIDFLSLPSRKERQIVDEALSQACGTIGPHKCTALNGFGFAQIVRPRNGPSIPEILCGVTSGRASPESLAIALLRDAARSQGHGPRTLTALPRVADVLQQWPEEIAALRQSLGVAIEIVADPNTTNQGHIYVRQS